jgi:hypothetical protein
MLLLLLLLGTHRGAGTNCPVHLVMYGSAGHSGELLLENHKDNFSRGRVDTFTLDLPGKLVVCGGGGVSGAWMGEGLVRREEQGKEGYSS